MMKRLLALLLALTMLLPILALADEDEEVSLDELVEDVVLEADGSETEVGEEDEEAIDEGEVTIGDEAQEAIEILDAEIDETVDPDSLDLNTNLPDNVVNILLVGIDTRDTTMDDGLQHGDVQIICSINKDTGSVKLTSLQRDLYVSIPGYKSKNRINVAYARGGGQLAMRTINSVFEMNIEYYVTINFYGLASIIDAIGGIDIELTKAEAKAINSYLKKNPPVYDNQDKDYERVPLEAKAGVQHLDGVQAVMYARTRSVDNDFGRTARQRKLLELLLQKIMKDNMSVDKLIELMQVCLPYVTTNLNASTMLELGIGVLNSDIISRAQAGEELLEQHRIPMDDTWKYDQTDGGSSVVVFRTVKRRQENIEALHQFIYGEYIPAK